MNIKKIEKEWRRVSDDKLASMVEKLFDGVTLPVNHARCDNANYRISAIDGCPNDVCTNVSRLSYPPENHLTDRYGRGNWRRSPMLYLSAHPYSPFQELSIDVDQTFATSAWECLDKIRFVNLGVEKRGIFTRPLAPNKISRKLLDFISNEFCRFPIHDNSDYRLSACIAEFILNNFGHGDDKFDAIIYPSVRSEFFRENTIVKPSTVDRSFRIKSAKFGKLSSISSDRKSAVYIPLYKSHSIDYLTGTISWEPCDGTPEDIVIEPT